VVQEAHPPLPVEIHASTGAIQKRGERDRCRDAGTWKFRHMPEQRDCSAADKGSIYYLAAAVFELERGGGQRASADSAPTRSQCPRGRRLFQRENQGTLVEDWAVLMEEADGLTIDAGRRNSPGFGLV